MPSMPFSFSSAGLVVLAGVSAALLYQNIDLTRQLDSARAETGQCLALNRSLQLAAAGMQAQVAEAAPGCAPDAQSQSAAPEQFNNAVHPGQEPAQALAAEPPTEPLQRPTTLQEAFQVRTAARSAPISTASPLGTGPWGGANP